MKWLITPTSVRYDVLRAQDIVHMKLDGTVLEGELQPSSEWRMHAAVYKAYGETNAVFHTHSFYATAFAVVRKSILAVLIESCIFLGGDIRCADYAAPGTEAVGTNAIPALRDRGGCTLANHGVLAVGKDLAQAYLRAEYIEDVASIYAYAKAIGEPVALDTL
ncbi:MAG: class II aldolase/adducin family protein [Oscillibacter sp.]